MPTGRSDHLKQFELLNLMVTFRHLPRLNKGKTEALLFGTAKKVANGSSDFRPSVNDKEITKTASYKYLGISIDSTLNMNTFFEKCYKKASS